MGNIGFFGMIWLISIFAWKAVTSGLLVASAMAYYWNPFRFQTQTVRVIVALLVIHLINVAYFWSLTGSY